MTVAVEPQFSLHDPNVETLIADIRARAQGWCRIDASTLLTLCDGFDALAVQATETEARAILNDLAKSYNLFARNNTQASMHRFLRAAVLAVERVSPSQDAQEPT